MSDNKKTPLPLEIMALELFGTVLMGTGIGMAGLPMGTPLICSTSLINTASWLIRNTKIYHI
jgi:hypothetical protein|tara:strand:+ start:300 stop:485 length:186 start_codon:yes stop_codon:yes gene_type:complete